MIDSIVQRKKPSVQPPTIGVFDQVILIDPFAGRNYSTDMRLLLFDVDGTLIHSNRAGRAAMVHALETLFGTAGPVDGYSMAGKTDPLIISELLQAAGVDPAEVDGKLEQVYELMARRGREIFPGQGIHPCVGVPELLERLEGRPDVLLGLVTGNIAPTAPLKLAAAGIDPAGFRVGAYGSDGKDRNQLPGVAMRRATALTGHHFDGDNTVVIGDTPADILCARSSGSRSLAVATGGHSLDTLARYSPDYLLPSLAPTEKVLRILLEQNGDDNHG
jgi:phosphoglycolate phosphatase-like HAD superfamily hydrolase